MTPYEQAALDLYLAFECSHQNHFSAELYRLIAKADNHNRNLLSQSYPTHVRLYEEWMLTSPAGAFYEKYHVKENYVPDNPGESHD